MIFIDKMKNFRIYKTPLFLPTLENDKKKKSVILLMTPNYESSKKIMTNPLFINKLRFSSYYMKRDVSYYITGKNIKEVELEESSIGIDTNSFLRFLPESCINMGDKVLFFNEDTASDNQLRKMIYTNRLKTRQELLTLYDEVKSTVPFIKFAFPEIQKYQGKNLFVDLSYYNKVFFENNNWVLNKGLNLYLTYMDRLLNDPELKSNGYQKKTIFIPINDWSKDSSIWNYRVSLNPLSIIYHLMINEMGSKLKETFGNTNVLFVANGSCFKINFSEIDTKEYKRFALKFKSFITKSVTNEEFDYEDIDTTSDNIESPDVIKANIIDKIELAKGIDITARVSAVSNKPPVTPLIVKKVANKDVKPKEIKQNISKMSLNQPEKFEDKKQEKKLDDLATAIDIAANNAKSEDEAWEELDNDEIKRILIDIDSSDGDAVKISTNRASRIEELDKQLLDTEIKGKTVKDILEPKEPKEELKVDLKISSPNEENWKNLSYANFDKNYDIDRDIIRCFRFFENTSRPISIRNITVEDNSTSEDRVALYTVEMEDYRGKRFRIKLDIPIMVDNRFLLRGNGKSIQTQFFNMPIIKTDEDTCQIISNYNKIFVYRFGSNGGKSLPLCSRFLKACNKYQGRKLKIETGDNTKVCSRYNLPIDYIDLSGSLNKISSDDFIIYFNQDEIRKDYEIEDGIGVPYLYNKKEKSIVYYEGNGSFVEELILQFEKYNYTDFLELINSSSSSTVSAYSRCSIMSSKIPLVIICAYHEGLRKTLDKAKVEYSIVEKLTKEIRSDYHNDWIKFKDGYLVFRSTYSSSLLLNGLKTCSTDLYEIADMDNKNMYIEFLDNFGGRIKADGLDNFYDLMIDPMIKDGLEYYKFPTDYVSILLYTNALLADNGFVKHTDTSSRRIRRYMLIAVYTYKVLSDAYALYANQLKHGRQAAEFNVKQSAVIDRFLTDTITSDDSCINALRDIETTNAITTKGPSGMNSDRAYSLDKRTYDESMINVLGMSTGFASNVGITRQTTINPNISQDGYVKSIDGDTTKMNTSASLTATEALTPFGTTHDDPMRTAMTFIQTSKHLVKTEDSDPLLVTNGSDEAIPYLTSNRFAYKANKNGKVLELTDDYILLEYEDGSKDFINLQETIEKNSDGGYFVPLKLDKIDNLKVGSKIEANQIVAYDKYSFSNSLGESDNLAYNIGKLAKVAIINTDEGFEDSGIITEKMAQKLATRVDLKFESTLDKNTNLLSIAKVGDKVEAGDPLMIWQVPFDEEEANSLMKILTGDDVSELGKRKLKSEVTGVVKSIKIYRTVELEDLSESLRKVVSEYEKPLEKLKKKLKDNNLDTSRVPAHYALEPTGKLKKAQDAVVFEFYVEYKDTVGVGDKIVYFAANKAVEKSIIPLGKEPYTDFRPNESVDAFVSETSIDKRIVTSSLIIGSLQKLMIELDRSVKDIMGIPYDDSTV